MRSKNTDRRPHIVAIEDEKTRRQPPVDHLDKQNFRVSGADGGVALRRLREKAGASASSW